MESRKEIETVVVYCSASEKVDKKYFEAAIVLGEILAKGSSYFNISKSYENFSKHKCCLWRRSIRING